MDLSATGQSATNPQIALSGSTAIAVWTRSNGTNNIIQTATSSNGGATWSAPVDLSATGQTSALPQIALSGSTAIATWHRSNGANFIVQAARSSDSGTTWSSPTDLSTTGGTAYNAQVAISSSTAIAEWYRYDGANHITQTAHSSDGGATWSAPVDLSAAGQNSDRPRLALAVSTAVAVWLRSNGTNNIVQTSRSTDGGATWSIPTDLSATGQDSIYPQVAMSAGSAVVVWARYDGAKYIVQAAVSSLGSSSGHDSTTPRAQFTYWLPDGRECTSISPQTYLVGTSVDLPDANALCGYDGSVIAGWRIPGQENAFRPGRTVPVTDSQQFTAVLAMPWILVTYDANVAAADTCLDATGTNLPVTERTRTQWIPRIDITTQPLPTTTPCTPPGHTLAGWTTRTTGSLAPGSPLPVPAVDTDGNHANTIHLYATWK